MSNISWDLLSESAGKKQKTTLLVGGWPTPLKKYEIQLGWLFPIYGKKNLFQTTSLDIIGPHIFENFGSISENVFHKISENASESIWNPRFF